MTHRLSDLSIELGCLAVFAVVILPAALLKAPDLVAFWPYPVAISGEPVQVSDAEIPVLRPVEILP